MAQELNVTSKIVYAPSVAGVSNVSIGEYDIFIDVEGSRYVAGTQLLEGGTEDVDSNDELGTIGYCFLKNIGQADAIVVFGGVDALLLKPGEFHMFRPVDKVEIKPEEQEATYIEYFMVEE